MILTYPLCLLALLGIPAIIIIYIIKSQYTEQTVSTTYIWTLSEKFLKRRNPLSGLSGIIALILQLLMILLISLALIMPIFTLKDKANEYTFILDASASMNMESTDGKTRFERGKEEIDKLIEKAPNGSEYTLIYAGGEASTVYEGLKSKENARKLLSDLSPSYTTSDIVAATGIAQKRFDARPGTLTYLVTDKTYRTHQNVTVVNVSSGEDNFGITALECEMISGSADKSGLYVKGILNSYKKGATLKVEIYVDEAETPNASATFVVPLGADFKFEIPPIMLEKPSYASVKAVISNADSYGADSEAIIYNLKNEKQYKTIIVSETPFFLQAVIDSLGDYDVETVTPSEYEEKYSSRPFGLYIFDSYTPSALPKSGAVWMINSDSSLENTGFSYRSDVVLNEPVVMEKSTSSQTAVRKLLDGLITKDIYLIKYLRYSTYGDYMTLYSYDGVPLIMAGENLYGNRTVVFAFDLHDSNLPATGDFVNLVGNLLDYSFPSVLDGSSYTAGDEIIINTVANSESVKVTAPSGKVKYLDTQKTMNEYVLEETGTYTVEVEAGGSVREHKLFAEAPLDERVPTVIEQNFSIIGTPSGDRLDGEFNPDIIIFIAIMVIFAADWMVYMYEKRQLR